MRTYGFGCALLLMSNAIPRSNQDRLSSGPAAEMAVPACVSTTPAFFNTNAPAEEATHINVPLFALLTNPATTNGTPTHPPKSPPEIVPTYVVVPCCAETTETAVKVSVPDKPAGFTIA